MKSIELPPCSTTPVHGSEFVIWDDGGDTATPDLLRLKKRHPEAQIVVLATFPRDYETSYYADQGAQVLAQPYHLSELFADIRKTAGVRRVFGGFSGSRAIDQLVCSTDCPYPIRKS